MQLLRRQPELCELLHSADGEQASLGILQITQTRGMQIDHWIMGKQKLHTGASNCDSVRLKLEERKYLKGGNKKMLHN